MTALMDMQMRTGGDPRHLEPFKQLREELGKVDHPACPDVDWARVEELCAVLFERNGADLQSTVAFVLASAHRHGLAGLGQGLAVLEALLEQWPRLWPSADSTRLAILDWLFRRLQVLLRGFPILPETRPTLLQLQAQLERIGNLVQPPLASLDALRSYLAGVMAQLQRDQPVAPAATPEPLLIPPPPPPSRNKSRIGWWLGALVLLASLVAGLAQQ